MIQGVLFDMDGVILDTEREGRTIFLKECARRGYPQVDEVFYEKLLGQTREADCALMKEAFGQDFPFDEMYEAYRKGLYELAERGELPTRPGLRECMEGLKARGIRIALATSTARPIVEMYQKHIPEMRDVFNFMVCGKEGGRSKPAPDIYLKAAEALGLPATSCLALEDAPAGIQSAYRAGCLTVMVPDQDQPSEETKAMLYAKADSLVDVISILEALK